MAELVDALFQVRVVLRSQVRVLFWAISQNRKKNAILLQKDEIVVQFGNPARQREAFAKVVSLYGEKLYWHIRKMALDHEDAKRLTQKIHF